MEESIWQEYKNEEFMILGISNESIQRLESFIEDQGITFPVLQDQSGVYGRYNQPGSQSPYPRDFIVDPEGILRYAATEYDPGAMIQIIESLLPTSVADTPIPEPKSASLRLHEISPIPAGREVDIVLTSFGAKQIQVKAHDMSGRLISSIYEGFLPPGEHRFSWNPYESGRSTTSGMYFITATQGESSQTRRAIFIR